MSEDPQLQNMEELEQVKREMEEWKRVAQAKSISKDNEQKVLVLQEKLQILRMRHQDDKKELERQNVELSQ